MNKNILILLPEKWYIEECCVKENSSFAPTGALLLAAYLRKLGHTPMVLTHSASGKTSFSLNAPPDVLVIYSPWYRFTRVVAPLFAAFKQNFPNCTTILLMQESLSDLEVQAMKATPSIDYAVIPNEKEISVGKIIEHCDSSCPDGFGDRSGIIYRDENGEPVPSGKHPYSKGLDHLPYSGDELLQFMRVNPNHTYTDYRALFQRGCPGTCVFCPLRCTRARYRNPDVVLDELQTAKNIFGKFGCGVLTHEAFRKPQKLEEFADRILKKRADIVWDIGTRCDYVNDVDLLKKLKASGVRGLYLGIEAPTEETREKLSKPISDFDIERTLECAAEADIGYHAAFIVGYPWEDEEHMQIMRETIGRIGSNANCVSVRLSQLIPYPGLPVEDMMINEGILPRKYNLVDWNERDKELAQSYRRTKHLNQTELDNWFKRLVAETDRLGCNKPEWVITQAAC